jgi:hypothetical protein
MSDWETVNFDNYLEERAFKATAHGWPISRYDGRPEGQSITNAIVNILVNSRMGLPVPMEGESSEEFEVRFKAARAEVVSELDAREDAFLAEEVDPDLEPEVWQEQITRFGGRAVDQSVARDKKVIEFLREIGGDRLPLVYAQYGGEVPYRHRGEYSDYQVGG